MNKFLLKNINLALVGFLFIFLGCEQQKQVTLNYDEIVNEVLSKKESTVGISDTADLFDEAYFYPATDSVNILLDSLQQIYEKDSAMIKKIGIKDSNLLNLQIHSNQRISNKQDSFSADIAKINSEELRALKYNLKQLHDKDSILLTTHTIKKGRIESRVWARINKNNQRLYLYIDGNIVDTFKVSTGSPRHETPIMDLQPQGPIFQKYTSKRYPGGNYNGLGNMPYAIFIKGGYALHGTTRGNIPRLGTKASHGCVRLHPDNAKILNELVRKAGLDNFWVTIEDGDASE